MISFQAAYDMELAKHATHAAMEMENTRRRLFNVSVPKQKVCSGTYKSIPYQQFWDPYLSQYAFSPHEACRCITHICICNIVYISYYIHCMVDGTANQQCRVICFSFLVQDVQVSRTLHSGERCPNHQRCGTYSRTSRGTYVWM